MFYDLTRVEKNTDPIANMRDAMVLGLAGSTQISTSLLVPRVRVISVYPSLCCDVQIEKLVVSERGCVCVVLMLVCL